MKRSTDHCILTTHMGSLPRPDILADLLVAQAEGQEVDAARIPALTDEAMDNVVRRQLDCGIDVGNDGEMPRSTNFGYITRRMSGFGGRTDCGFGTVVGDTQVSENVTWAKHEAMRDGAAIASKRLWN